MSPTARHDEPVEAVVNDRCLDKLCSIDRIERVGKSLVQKVRAQVDLVDQGDVFGNFARLEPSSLRRREESPEPWKEC